MKTSAFTTFVVFGATGDLFKKKILFSLFQLYKNKRLPKKFHILCYGRRTFTQDEFISFLESSLPVEFLSHLRYIEGQLDALEGFIVLKEAILYPNVLLYLAVPPQSYEVILKNLKVSKIKGKILVEKPFGSDLKSAEKLHKQFLKVFPEKDLFIIDHYLAKRIMQEIPSVRFGKMSIEEIWNNKYIESIEVSLFETIDVATRTNFYDSVGALRDVCQNHVLQMLALSTMEKSVNISAGRVKLLSKIGKPVSIKLSQYEGYTKELGRGSSTETYFDIETTITTPRWKGVKINLRGGKALREAKAEVVVHFKTGDITLFRIQPEEGIYMNGEKIVFKEKDNNDAYAEVIYNALSGDKTLFPSFKEIQASWKFIDPILKKKTKIEIYKKGDLI